MNIKNMQKYKIIRIFLVEAATRTEAMIMFADAVKEGKEDKYFQSEIVKVQEEDSGWAATIKKQLLGK